MSRTKIIGEIQLKSQSYQKVAIHSYICERARKNPKSFGNKHERKEKILEQHKEKRTVGKYQKVKERKEEYDTYMYIVHDICTI